MADNKVDDWVEVQDTEADDWEEVPEESPAPPDQEFKPEGSGFLGATMDTQVDPMALAEGAMNTLAGVGSGLPVVGPMVDELAKTEAVSGRPGGMSDEQYAKLVEMGGGAREAGEFLGTTGGFMAAPATIPAQMGLAGADMASRGAIGGQEITPEEVGIMAGATMAPAGLGKLAQKFKGMQEKMITKAGKQAETAAGLGASKKLRDRLSQLEKEGKIKPGQLGNELIEEGVVAAGDTPTSVAKKAKELADRADGEINETLGDLSTYAAGVQKDLVDAVRSPALSAAQEAAKNKVRKQAKLLSRAGEDISLKDLRKIRDEAAKKGSGGNKTIEESLSKSIDNALGEDELQKIRALRDKLQAGQLAEEGAGDIANQGMSGLRKMGIVTSMISGNPAIAGGLAAEHVISKYRPALAAIGLTKASQLGKYAERFADAAENRGKAGVGALHFQLMQDDPEYRKKNMKGKE